MPGNRWQGRQEIAEYLAQATAHEGEYLEFLVEADMKRAPPCISPLQIIKESKRRMDEPAKRSPETESPNSRPLQEPPTAKAPGRQPRDPRLRKKQADSVRQARPQDGMTLSAGHPVGDKEPTSPKPPAGTESRQDSRQLTEMVARGLQQREESLERWEEKICQYMEFLTDKEDLEAFCADEYWHTLPEKVNSAERACKKYKKRMSEIETEKGSRRISLKECKLCGRVFLEKGRHRDTLEAHRNSHH